MRNITEDLKQRINEIEIEIGKSQKHVNDLSNRQKSLRLLLEAEERRWRAEKPSLFPQLASEGDRTLPPLSQFLMDSLRSGEKTIELLKKEIEDNRVAVKADKPGRAIHSALVQLSRKGLTEKQDGKWRLASGSPTSVAGRSDLRVSAHPTQPV